MNRLKRLLFWRKPKWIETPAQTMVIPPGKYTVSYSVKTDGKTVNSSTMVYPTVSKPESEAGNE